MFVQTLLLDAPLQQLLALHRMLQYIRRVLSDVDGWSSCACMNECVAWCCTCGSDKLCLVLGLTAFA